MGRIIFHVDVVEILSLAWDHPIVTGCLVLLFTPPFFPVIVFFSPLLISTALCAVALVSAGHQIEATREREIAGWNARILEGERLSARFNNVRRRTRVPGEERWVDWVQGFEPGSSFNASESTLMNDMKEEGLKAEFRADEGGVDFIEEEFLDRQIEAFREYERSFSFRGDGRDCPGTLSNANASTEIVPSMEMVPFPKEGRNTVQEIPPMFLHNLRTGGTGKALSSRSRRTASRSGAGNQSGRLLAFGSFDISGMSDTVEELPGDRSLFRTSSSPSPGRGRSAMPQGIPVAQEKIVFRQGPIKRDHSWGPDFVGFNTMAAVPGASPVAADRIGSRQSPINPDYYLGTEVRVKTRAQLRPGGPVEEIVSHGSAVTPDHSWGMNFVGPSKPTSAVPDVSHVTQRSVSRPSIAPAHSWERGFAGVKTTGFEGLDSSRNVFQQSLRSSSWDAAKPSEENVTASPSPNYNAALRFGNAAAYNASSGSGSAATSEPEVPGMFQTNQQSYRDRRVSTARQRRRHLAREKSSKHPFQLDIRTLND